MRTCGPKCSSRSRTATSRTVCEPPALTLPPLFHETFENLPPCTPPPPPLLSRTAYQLSQTPPLSLSTDSIFYDDKTSILFASFKYVGYDYAGDMERMASNPKVREWWKMTDGYQESFTEGAVSSEAGEPSWWKPVEEVFYYSP